MNVIEDEMNDSGLLIQDFSIHLSCPNRDPRPAGPTGLLALKFSIHFVLSDY